MDLRSEIIDILNNYYPRWGEQGVLPGDILITVLSYMVEIKEIVENYNTETTTLSQLWSEVLLIDDKKHGTERCYDDDECLLINNWRNGVMHGTQRVYSINPGNKDNIDNLECEIFWLNGKQRRIVEYHSGYVFNDTPMLDSKIHGVRKGYYPFNHAISFEREYRLGVLYGDSIDYDLNGAIVKHQKIDTQTQDA